MGQEAVTIARQLGDVQLLGELLSVTALTAPDDQRRDIYLETLACARQSGDDLVAASELHKLYGEDLKVGRIEAARACLDEAVALAEDGVGGDYFLYGLRTELALVLLIQGSHAQAEPLIRECLLVVRRLGFDADASELLFGAACCATWRGDYARAATLHGAADTDIKRAIGDGVVIWLVLEKNLQDEDQAKLRELMGDEAYQKAYRSGTELPPAQAIDLALGRTLSG
jgi:tetratricopeptide (TPR) repeat protein